MKLQNDEHLKHAIQTPEFRAKMESSSQRVQAALLQERMSAQTPNEYNANTQVIHYGDLYKETLIELFGEKTPNIAKLRKEPNHPDIYKARAAQNAAIVLSKRLARPRMHITSTPKSKWRSPNLSKN